MRRADHSFRGVLPSVCVCLNVCDLATSTLMWPRTVLGYCPTEKKGNRSRRPWTWKFASSCLLCCVGKGPCDGQIIRSEESYRVCVCLNVCDLETSTLRWPRTFWVIAPQKKKGDRSRRP